MGEVIPKPGLLGYVCGTCVMGLVLVALLVEWTLAPAVFVAAIAGYGAGASYGLAYIRANGGVRASDCSHEPGPVAPGCTACPMCCPCERRRRRKEGDERRG